MSRVGWLVVCFALGFIDPCRAFFDMQHIEDARSVERLAWSLHVYSAKMLRCPPTPEIITSGGAQSVH